ncbi:MAG: lipopolysaccharide biosynthesis protein [Solirubrobacteraceae bacterium]
MASTAAKPDGYARGARVLSIGIASTGVFTFAYFAVASHVLGSDDYGAISLLWSVLFVVLSVIYRPVEQLLARTIAERRAAGREGGHPLRTPATIQGGFALGFLVVALALRSPLEDAFGSTTLYWVFVVATIAYAASYFARGWFAGHQWFGFYGGLVLFESVSRFCFPLAVAVGVASGQTAVALGIAAAPIASLLVLPWALRREEGAGEGGREQMAMREGGGFALSVAGVQLAEQALLNAAVVVVAAQADSAAAGVVFSALLIVRAPLQLFQSIQTSLLPHLAGGGDAARAIRVTVLAIAGFAGLVAIGLLAIGPWAMDLLFDDLHDYGRVGLALLAVGMGFHLAAGTLNQALLAADRAAAAALTWLGVAAGFVVFVVAAPIDDRLLRTEIGYVAAAALLAALLATRTRGLSARRASPPA